MKKTIITLLAIAAISGCVRTHDKLGQKKPLLIPPSYGNKPDVKEVKKDNKKVQKKLEHKIDEELNLKDNHNQTRR